MANPRIFYKDNDKDKNKKEPTKDWWKNLKDNSPLAIAAIVFPLFSFYLETRMSEKKYQEDIVQNYVEFNKAILFDAYYSSNKQPRIPSVSVANFIGSKTVSSLRVLEQKVTVFFPENYFFKKSNTQEELLNFMRQAKIGFISDEPKDYKWQDIPPEDQLETTSASSCPLTYPNSKQNSNQSHTSIDNNNSLQTEKVKKINNSCLLTGINLQKINLSYQDLRFSVLKNVNLRGATLEETQFQRAILIRADLSQAKMNRSYLERTNLYDADLKGAEIKYADLTKVNLEEADLSPRPGEKTYLTGSVLEGANLKGTILTNVDLKQAILKDANLKNANLRNANLRNANLTGANLDGADLTLANLRGVKIEKGSIYSQFSQDTTFCQTILPDGTILKPECNPHIAVAKK